MKIEKDSISVRKTKSDAAVYITVNGWTYYIEDNDAATVFSRWPEGDQTDGENSQHAKWVDYEEAIA